MRKRNWLKTTIAMITLIATVLETGFTSVSTLAAEITTEDGIVVNNDAVEESEQASNSEDDLQIEVSSDSDNDYVEEDTVSEDAGEAEYAQEETYEEAEELKDGTLDVSDSGISGSGYDEISVYVDTEGLKRKDRFRLEFQGPASASYNPVLNEDLDKTNGGRYDFESLEGGDFSVRANSSDDVILSYKYNEDGYPTVVVESAPAEKILNTKTLTTSNDEEIQAVSGEGYDSVRIRFNTEELSDKASFKLYVETNANATVDGSDATEGIRLDNRTGSVTVEDLGEESFDAYVISDNDEIKIKAIADVDSVEDGEVTFTVDNENVKRVYEYEDAKVKVTATLEKADAIPDDAYFCVTPLTEEEAQKYIEALNASLEEGQPEVTADDILLYDIAFYTDESKEEEIEPEEGSVSVSIEFKKNQVSEELGVEDENDVNVTHFEEKGNSIEPVTVDVEKTYDTDSVEFSVESFSVYGVWADTMAKVEAGKTVSYSDILGDAVSYGIVANELTLSGHMETNFAVGKMHGSAQIQACRNEGNGAGLVYIGEYDDNSKSFLMDKNNNSGVVRIITTQDVLDKMDPAMKNRSGVVIDTNSMDKVRIQKLVKDMVDEVAKNSSNLMKEKNCYQYASIQKNGVVDFTSKGAGTYYISFDTSEGADNNKFPGSGYTIKINSDQNVVLNIPYGEVDFGQYHLWVGNKEYTPQANSDEEILFEKLIFNCPNATKVTTSTPVTGTFIAPGATFTNNGVAAGFLVANHFAVGGSEWHTISKTIDIVEDDETEFTLDVKKILKDINGNVVDDGLWPEEGFTFKLSKYLLNDPGDLNKYDNNIIRVKKDIPDVDGVDQVTIYKDTPEHKAEFGKLKFTGKSVYDNKNAHASGTYSGTKYISFMYKIQEVKGNDSAITYNTTPVYIKFFVNSQKVTTGNSTKYYVWVETKVSDTVSEWRCEPGTPEIVNTYNELEIPVEFKGTKKVNGNSQKVESGKFGFTLYQYSGSNKWTPIQEDVSNVGSSVTFEPIVLKKGTGWDDHSTFYFLIDETRCDSPYTEDQSKFVAKVQLYMDGKQLKKSVKYYKYKAGETVDVNKARNEADGYFFSATEFVYDNTYTPTGKIQFFGTKELIGRPVKAEDEFTFTLTCDDPSRAEKDNQTVTVKAVRNGDVYELGDFEFAALSYGQADIGNTYNYQIKETTGSEAGMSYSNNVYDIAVTVADNGLTYAEGEDGHKAGDPKLTVTRSPENRATETNRAKFTNTYDAKGGIKISATKSYGSGLKTDKNFGFTLSGDEFIAQTKSVEGTGTAYFYDKDKNGNTVEYKLSDLPKNSDGTYGTKSYKYVLKEEIPSGAVDKEINGKTYKVFENVIYDSHEYHILVVVSYDTATKSLKKDVYGRVDVDPEANDTYKIDSVIDETFTNDYIPGDVTTPVAGKKDLLGDTLQAGVYTFNLEADDDTTRAAIAAGDIEMPKTSVKNGEAPAATANDFVFGDITFHKAETYNFKVTEDQSTKIENVVNATDVYKIAVTVSYDANGDLTIKDTDKHITKVGKVGDLKSIGFVNMKINPGEIPLIAEKELDGKTLEANAFEFALLDAADADTDKPRKKALQIAKNDANGNVTFEPLTYNFKDLGGDSKVFRYVIRELIPDNAEEVKDESGKVIAYKKDGYTYDGHKEYVNVTVTAEKAADDTYTRNLIVKADNATDASHSSTNAEIKPKFKNKYETKGSAKIEGIKKLLGNRKFENGVYSVQLIDMTTGSKDYGKVIQTAPITKVSNPFVGEDAEFEFQPIEYTAEGTYKYLVKEIGSMPGVTNDPTGSTTGYSVTVVMNDNGKGELTGTPDPARKELCFTNQYKGEGTVQFIAKKLVNGKVSANNKFTFTLFDVDANKQIDSATNKDGGLIEFKELKYTEKDLLEDNEANRAAGKVVTLNDGTVVTAKKYLIQESAVSLDHYRKKDNVDVTYTAYAYLWINEEGKLEVKKAYFKDGVEVPEATVEFENEYDATGTVKLLAEKKLTGAALPAGKFTFELYEEDGITPVKIKQGDELVNVTATNAAADEGKIGEAVFPVLSYDETDLTIEKSHQVEVTNTKRVYAKHYVMKEFHPSTAVLQADGSYKDADGYTYDGKAYNVVVTLTDTGTGSIATEWYAYSEGSAPDKITVWDKIVEFVTGKNANQHAEFDNKYEAEGALVITALKKLAGKTLTKDAFTFTLSGVDEDGNNFTDTKKNDADGNVVFDRLTYKKPTKEGKPYVYTITEVHPDLDSEGFDKNRVHYDTTVYTVTVTVTDPGLGKLKVTPVITADPAVKGTPSVTYTDDVNGKKAIELCQAGPLVFENTYRPEPITIRLGGNKTLTGRKIENGEFKFELKPATGNDKKFADGSVSDESINVGKIFTFNKGITFDITDLPVDANGVYASSRDFAYEITEVIPDGATFDKQKQVWVKDKVVYDKNNKVTVIVTLKNDGSGVLTATYKVGENTFTDPAKVASFKNDYDAVNATVFSVQKKLVLDEEEDSAYIPKEKKYFNFELTGDGIDPAHPLKATASSEGEVVDFAPITYKLSDLTANNDGTYGPNVFKYTVKETGTDNNGIKYSKEVYNAEVTVSSDGESKDLTIARTVNYKNEAGKTSSYDETQALVFTNRYKAQGTLEIEGKKTFVSTTPLKENQFEFILSQSADGSEGTYSKIDSVKNDANGDFKFELQFTHKDIGDTFYYQVNEFIPANATELGIEYDEKVYDLVVTVVDNGDGTLGFNKLVDNELKDKIYVPFKNTEIIPDGTSFEATKSLTGKALKENMFTYVLLDSKGEELQRKPNAANTDGKPNVFFDPITYEFKQLEKGADGKYGKTFEYQIRELGRQELGKPEDYIEYDKRLYKVYVDVTVENGVMNVAEPVYKLDGEVVSGALFENKYKSEDVVEIGGHKILKGFVDGATPIEEYKFELLDENGNIVWINKDGRISTANAADAVEQVAKVTPKNAKDIPEYKFDKIVFNQDDYLDTAHPDHKFYFKVREQIPTTPAPNVEYAYIINEYNVTVELSYDAQGKLVATASDDRNVGVKNLDFTNVYKAEGKVQFGGVKEVVGKNLVSKAYEFNLFDLGKDGKANPTDPIESVNNDGAAFAFGQIDYDQSDIGEHYYKITESAKTADGSEYDHSEYIIKVTIDQGADGKLDTSKQEITWYHKDSKDTLLESPVLGPNDVVKFTNNYEAYADLDIEGIKFMYNQPLVTGDYEFVLKDENGNELATVSHEGAYLNKIDDLEAQAGFKFSHEDIEALNFSHKDFELQPGVYSEKPIKKYFTVEEKAFTKAGTKRVYKTDKAYQSYIVEVTLTANGTKELEKSVRIFGDNLSKNDANGITGVLKNLKDKLFGKGDDEIIFQNEYDSECTIDPPILRKQMVGKTIERGEFRFKIEGPGLRSQGQDWKDLEKGYTSIVTNGYANDGVSIYDKEGKLISEGEIHVGDIKYKFIDLIDPNIDPASKEALLQRGKAQRTFIYYAYELAPGEEDYKGEEGVDYAFASMGRQRQKFKLEVRAKDMGDGTIELRNARDEVVNFKDVNFFWEPLSEYALSDTDMKDTFLNTFNREGSIDIEGVKEMVGRELTKDDKFEFKITDATPGGKYEGQSALVENTAGSTGNGELSKVLFAAKKIENGKEVENIPFLNYRFGAWLEDDGVTITKIDDTGDKVYIIEETDKYDNVYPGVTRDKSKFKVLVSVKEIPGIQDKHGLLEAKITGVYKIDPKSGVETFFDPKNFQFDNTFEAKGKIDFAGIKYLKDQGSNELASPDALLNQYGFAIYQYKDAEVRKQTTGKGQGLLIDDTRTDDKGAFTLDVPEYTQEVMKNEKAKQGEPKYDETKTLYYRIIETKPSNGKWYDGVFESEGVIYDNTEYDVDVKLTLEKDANGKYTGKILTEKDIKKVETGEKASAISFTNTIKKYRTVEGNKYWIDNFTDPSKRPTVTVNLYQRTASGVERKINEYKIVAPDTTYRFATDSEGNKLPTYDSAGRPLTYIVEESPIEGYLSEKIDYDFYNTAGDILIRKIDADTRAPLSGAELAIMDGSTEIERWTSGASAHVVGTQLTFGKTYTLREISAPEGYGVADDMTFTVPTDGSSITVTMSDPPIVGSVRLVKRDASTRETLAGAEFALYTEAGARIYATGSAGSYTATTTTSNGVFVTDASGALTISNLPYGTYRFVEVKAPEGYSLSTERLGFTILRSGELVEVTYLNTKAVGSVRLRKVGSAGTRGLAGAVFELYAATPRTMGQAASSTIFSDAYYRYGTYRTNSAGEIYVGDLPWDDYYFVEVDAPDGYEVMTDVNGDDLVYTFTIGEATTDRTISLGDIVNNPEETTPPPRGVLGERVKKGGVVNGVLGVRAKPNSGVLGERIGPVTGDASNIILWSLLLAACLATIVATIMTGRKKKTAK